MVPAKRKIVEAKPSVCLFGGTLASAMAFPKSPEQAQSCDEGDKKQLSRLALLSQEHIRFATISTFVVNLDIGGSGSGSGRGSCGGGTDSDGGVLANNGFGGGGGSGGLAPLQPGHKRFPVKEVSKAVMKEEEGGEVGLPSVTSRPNVTNSTWEENLPFTPPTWTRNIVPLPPPLQAKIALLRRAFIDWLLRSSACQSDQRLDSHSLRSRLCAVTMRLAVVWGLPPGLAHVLHVVALYTAWSDREAEAELISPSSSSSSAFPSAPFSVGNAGANLFHLLAGRICFLNEQLSGRLLASASESLRDMLACLWGDSSGVDSVSREGAPSVAEQVSSARRLVDFLVHHLPRQSNQRAMTMELGELLQTIDKSPQ
ncbi:hypothetical protein TcWFU_002956 [Taenia crassiceps]|uniref:Uncharacterized protein n=1 Tax=Taenia crassiceps TaxID=6207 RepID=A0ABR4QPX6_9CEST